MNYEKALEILESYAKLEDYIIEKSKSLLKWYGESIIGHDYSHFEYESNIYEEDEGGIKRFVSFYENGREDYMNMPLSLFFMDDDELEKCKIEFIRDREEKEKIRKEEREKAKRKKQEQAEESEYKLYLKLQEKYEMGSIKGDKLVPM